MTYDKKYDSDNYYWGKEPSSSAITLIKYIKSNPGNKITLLDLGCGEGRNAVHFACCGFDVTAIDISQKGLDKTKKLALEKKVRLSTELGDIRSISLSKEYDVIFSSGTFHYLSPDIRQKQIIKIQNKTKLKGINAINVFVQKPFINLSPDTEESAFLYKSGELLGYYADWEILFTSETIFDCMSGDKPHKHAMNSVIAKKMML